MLETFLWKGFRGVRRHDKEQAIQAFLALRHYMKDFADGRSVSGFEVNGERFFVKRYRAPLRLWRPLRRSKERNAMLNEAMWLQRLESGQVAVPQPWLFMERRVGREVETFLVMSEVVGMPLALLEGEAFIEGALRSIEMIGMLHAQGVSHGDCNLYNFLIADEAHSIDFERAAELTPALAEADVQKFFSRIKARGKAHLLEQLAQVYLLVQPRPLFDLCELVATTRAREILPVETRWRCPQFVRVLISEPGV
ncbi:lipopolysaccharide kinase InaA family protein [Pseudomonas sp. PDM11]|uniref:lipopolysaccharide kinase InaA family protein n=1 Tax=Pseudomonas sp. PDM11 TaxID=2769309 RepID=UPI0017840B6A|nr:lipopolysaccharide kinase InaA family protein [Pseudomonas sp. PDM11]MBD9398828.1 hypothetical protein [Pseudomonas sp. PDM11]